MKWHQPLPGAIMGKVTVDAVERKSTTQILQPLVPTLRLRL
jgi:hypothetical protein